MEDDQRKRLTEFIGECWHEPNDRKDVSPFNIIPCKCGKAHFAFDDVWRNYTFATGNDLLALKDKLVEKGMWDEFMWYADFNCDVSPIGDKDYINWLISMPRFAELTAEFLEEASHES